MPARAQVFKVSMIRGDKDQPMVVIPGFDQASQNPVKNLQYLNGLLHILVVTDIIAQPVLEEGEIKFPR